jgi:RNA polymerase sigma-70 factor, ECF subfamily
MPLLTATVRRGLEDPASLAVLAGEALSGDTVAVEALFRKLAPRARNLVRYLVRGDRDADDIAQLALLQVLQNLRSFHGTGAFTAWSDRVVVRATFAELRRRKRERRLDTMACLDALPSGERTSVPVDYLARRETIQLLDRVSEEQRTALVLHYVLELSIPEIARELGVNAETIKSRIRFGKARLRELGVRNVPGDPLDAEPLGET